MNQKYKNRVESFNLYIIGIIIIEFVILISALIFVIIKELSAVFGESAVSLLTMILFFGILIGIILNERKLFRPNTKWM